MGDVKLKNSQQRKQKCGGEKNRCQGSGPLISSGCTEALGGSLCGSPRRKDYSLSEQNQKRLESCNSTPRGQTRQGRGGAILRSPPQTSCPTLRVGVQGYSLNLFVQLGWSARLSTKVCVALPPVNVVGPRAVQHRQCDALRNSCNHVCGSDFVCILCVVGITGRHYRLCRTEEQQEHCNSSGCSHRHSQFRCGDVRCGHVLWRDDGEN